MQGERKFLKPLVQKLLRVHNGFGKELDRIPNVSRIRSSREEKSIGNALVAGMMGEEGGGGGVGESGGSSRDPFGARAIVVRRSKP